MRIVHALILAACIAVAVGGASALDHMCNYQCVLAQPCNDRADACLDGWQGATCMWCDSDFSDNLCVKHDGTVCIVIAEQTELCGDMLIGTCTGDPLECVGYRPGGICGGTRCSL